MNKDSDQTSILIVDDTETNVRLLSHVVKSEGYKVISAFSGEEALKMVEKERPNLILLDVMMPEMDGFEVCKRLKEDDRYEDVPVIFLSALTETDSKVKGFKVGGVDYITKPFQRQEVLARIDLHLKLKNLQQELKTKVKQLEERELRLRQLNEEKDDLMRVVSHDFKNPVSGIIGLVEMLLESGSDLSRETRKNIYQAMKESGGKLINLVEELLSHDAESPLSKLDTSKVELNKLVTGVVELHKPTAINKNISLKTDLKEGIVFELDRHKIEQVLSNLISNSLKFTPEGGEIVVKMRGVNVTGDSVKLSVSDTGIGMTQEQLNSLWNGSLDIRRTGTRGEESTGIGLQLVKNFIELHNGSIEVQSEKGEGTTFEITLNNNILNG